MRGGETSSHIQIRQLRVLCDHILLLIENFNPYQYSDDTELSRRLPAMLRTLFLTTVLVFAPVFPAHAQALSFDRDAVVAACQGGNCAAFITNVVADLRNSGLTPDEINSQLGLLAALLVALAQDASEDTLAALSDALNEVAIASTDAVQADAIIDVARAVADGQAGQIDTSNPIGASPS